MPPLSIPPRTPDPLHNDRQPDPRPPSPTAPPYSPITPTMSNSLPAPSTEAAAANSSSSSSYTKPRTQHPPAPPPSAPLPSHAPAPQSSPSQPAPPPPPTRPPPTPQMPALPPPVPVRECSNPDAIALRAAMSVLQLQRQQALRDMQTLERQKEAAVADPEAFARDVAGGKIRARGMRGILGPVGEVREGFDGGNTTRTGGVDGGSADGGGGGGEAHGLGDGDDGDDDATVGMGGGAAFGEIPSGQNVVRMPPVNWAKYHIVGASLDKLHEEQRSRPVAGQPLRDGDVKLKPRAPEHVVASPYDPWRDRLDGKDKGRTRSGRGKG